MSVGEPDGQLILGDRDDTTVLGVHHRDRRTPEALARDEPVAEAIRLRGAPRARSLKNLGDPRDGVPLAQAIQRPGVDQTSFTGERHPRLCGIDGLDVIGLLRERTVLPDDRDGTRGGCGRVHNNADG